jgi:hypothetical protein
MGAFMPTSPIVQLQLAFAVGVVLFALWKGGAAERLTALVVAANVAAGLVIDGFFESSTAVLRFVTDGVTAIALLPVAMRWASPWMGAVMLFYASQFSLHAYYELVERNQRDYLHAVINNINFSGVTLCLAAGAAAAWRRRVRTARRTAAGPSSPARRR